MLLDKQERPRMAYPALPKEIYANFWDCSAQTS